MKVVELLDDDWAIPSTIPIAFDVRPHSNTSRRFEIQPRSLLDSCHDTIVRLRLSGIKPFWLRNTSAGSIRSHDPAPGAAVAATQRATGTAASAGQTPPSVPASSRKVS